MGCYKAQTTSLLAAKYARKASLATAYFQRSWPVQARLTTPAADNQETPSRGSVSLSTTRLRIHCQRAAQPRGDEHAAAHSAAQRQAAAQVGSEAGCEVVIVQVQVSCGQVGGRQTKQATQLIKACTGSCQPASWADRQQQQQHGRSSHFAEQACEAQCTAPT